MRPLLVVTCAGLLATTACPRLKPDAPLPPTTGARARVDEDADAGPGATPKAAARHEDKRKDTLAGLSVEAREEGPWSVRSTTAGSYPGAGSSMGDAPAEAGLGVSGLGSGGGGTGGDAARRSFKAGGTPRPAPPRRMEAAPEPAPPPAPPAEAYEEAPATIALMPSTVPQASPLKAGATDDNEELDKFLKFLAEWQGRPETSPETPRLDVSDRRFLEVVNAAGKPVPGAEIDVYDANTERPLFSGTTYGDGRVPFYPKVSDPKGEAASWLVNVRRDGRSASATWRKDGEVFQLTLDADKPVQEPVALDVLFLIDTTGSMSDEIQRVKDTLLSVTKKLRETGKEFDLRYAAVLYKDVGDEYVTSTHPFTSDIAAFDQALQGVGASGGGDGPESLNQGLAETVHGVKWRERAAKVAFLIADAEPHLDYEDDVSYLESAKDAVARGVRIHAVAASGLTPFGTLCFRQIAQYTRGKFIFIEYGSPAASAAAHGVTGEVKSNNLDDIVFEQIQWELANYGRAGK